MYGHRRYSFADWEKYQSGQETIEGMKREFVAKLIAEGKTPREIAGSLFKEGYTSAKTKGRMSLSSVYHIIKDIKPE